MSSIGSLSIKNTKNLLNADTRICTLLYAPAKFGKTELASSLNDFTLKRRGKPTLIIASEVAEGGGCMTLNMKDIDYVMPKNWSEMESLLASLATNDVYGGVVLDNASDYVARIVKPHALAFPTKEKVLGARTVGVPVRSDYQVMGECCRTQLNRLINLTNENTPEAFRKDLIVTALMKEEKDNDGNITGIVPDLPGALAGAVVAMFNSVISIGVKNIMVKNVDGSSRRVPGRILYSQADGLKRTDDRTGIFSAYHEKPLTTVDGNPIGIIDIYNTWLGKEKASV